MPKPRSTAAQSQAIIQKNSIVRQLCAAEQLGHRAMISHLKLLEKKLGLREPKGWVKRIQVDVKTKRALLKEIEWRKIQIQILEYDRIAAHNMIKYHTRLLVDREILTLEPTQG